MPTRLLSSARREQIVNSTRAAFAEKGLDGVTSKELAKAAGISEGLLFKHFKTKERLYDAIRGTYRPPATMPTEAPSTQALLKFLRGHLDWMLENAENPDHIGQGRLLMRSLAEDRAYARGFFGEVFGPQVAWVERCLRQARKAGELNGFDRRLSARSWLAYLIQVMLLVTLQANPPVVDYGASRGALAQAAFLFMVRGLGLKEEAIQRFLKTTQRRN